MEYAGSENYDDIDFDDGDDAHFEDNGFDIFEDMEMVNQSGTDL